MVTVWVLLLLLSASSPPVHSLLTSFHIIQDKMNYTEAREACREKYTDLVTVYSAEDNTELGMGSSWIGLYRGLISEKWSNGDPVTFRNLTRACGTSACCSAMKTDGSWESLQCTETRYFMCYTQDSSSQTHDYLILENKTWYEAQSYCRQIYTDLVSIRDQQYNEVVRIKGLKSPMSFWIGLLRDDWEWADGGNSAYRNWGSREPLSFNCVQVIEGSWHIVSCNNEHFALCYRKTFFVSEESLSWEKALDYCQEEDRAGMLQIESEDDQKDVVNELKRGCVSEPVWVGLRQSRLFGFWIWSDGKAVFPYSNWDVEKPPEHQLSQHCGAVDPQRHYRWRDKNCQAQYRVLCYSTCSH